MRLVEILEHLDDDRRSDLLRFVGRVAGTPGGAVLSDHLRLDLEAGGGPGFVAVRVADAGGTIAVAQISAANDGSVLEVVVDPRAADDAVHDDALETAIDVIARRGGRVTWWLDDPDARLDALATGLGLALDRRLHEMRRGLPLGEQADIETRSFVPGRDDEAWIAVNNRAFAGHGEQGGWTVDTLRQRMIEPWFDPDGFRIHERDGAMLGFCWTKVHADVEPPVGEIYVIAVDPAAHGRGLGRQLTLAGLDSLAGRGIGVANLYVDAGNIAAMGLYEGLGFDVHRTRAAYTATFPPPTP